MVETRLAWLSTAGRCRHRSAITGNGRMREYQEAIVSLVGGPGRRCVGELIDRIDDPKPDRHTGEVIGRRELINPPDAFRLGHVAVPAEHQLSGAPNVDLGDHDVRLSAVINQAGRHCHRGGTEMLALLPVALPTPL